MGEKETTKLPRSEILFPAGEGDDSSKNRRLPRRLMAAHESISPMGALVVGRSLLSLDQFDASLAATSQTMWLGQREGREGKHSSCHPFGQKADPAHHHPLDTRKARGSVKETDEKTRIVLVLPLDKRNKRASRVHFTILHW